MEQAITHKYIYIYIYVVIDKWILMFNVFVSGLLSYIAFFSRTLFFTFTWMIGNHWLPYIGSSVADICVREYINQLENNGLKPWKLSVRIVEKKKTTTTKNQLKLTHIRKRRMNYIGILYKLEWYNINTYLLIGTVTYRPHTYHYTVELMYIWLFFFFLFIWW